ncbi:MAG: 4-hydroxy-3-methylbut-2-enyl diphosphate reductase [Desulfuromonadales bacterium]|nr:4-hydroxy-3-methylbut-2-enyl diphosphate reductase [Desulfuromonadales bacterium]
MKIVRAERAGMCMGVNLALSKLDALLARMPQPGSLFILGSIIHNPQVVRAYAEKGVITVQSPAEIPAGTTAVIRAHGVTKDVEIELNLRGVQIVDATCPKVKAACLLIEKHTASGRILLLYGEATHPEVKCLLSYAAAGAFVFDSREACAALTFDPAHSYCLAAQTTQDKAVFKEISTGLKDRADLDLIVLDTICDATRERQDEAVRIAREVDFVVVAGGYESSNTRRLAQVVLSQGTPALHIETAEDLPLEELKKYQRIGLTAGASTPKVIVDEIQRVLETL